MHDKMLTHPLYIQSVQEGPYAVPDAKTNVAEQIEVWRQEYPTYQEVLNSGVWLPE